MVVGLLKNLKELRYTKMNTNWLWKCPKLKIFIPWTEGGAIVAFTSIHEEYIVVVEDVGKEEGRHDDGFISCISLQNVHFHWFFTSCDCFFISLFVYEIFNQKT